MTRRRCTSLWICASFLLGSVYEGIVSLSEAVPFTGYKDVDPLRPWRREVALWIAGLVPHGEYHYPPALMIVLYAVQIALAGLMSTVAGSVIWWLRRNLARRHVDVQTDHR
jgi:hypothetical protein